MIWPEKYDPKTSAIYAAMTDIAGCAVPAGIGVAGAVDGRAYHSKDAQ
jgi:hypothetical protein